MKTHSSIARIITLSVLLAAIPTCRDAAQTGTSATIRRMVDSVSAVKLESYVRALEYAGGTFNRVDFTPGYDSAAAFLKRTFDSFRFLTSVQYDTFFVSTATPPFNSTPLVNVVATLAGKKDPSKIILIGAHLDACASKESTWKQQWQTLRAPGADDDASGVAALVELARIISDTAFHFANDYTIQFAAFGAEESVPAYPIWTYGSLHFAQEARARGKNIVGTICLDMIGYNNSFMYAAVVSDSQSTWLGEHCRKINEAYNIGLIMNTPPFPMHSYSDHASFWASGYPAILLIENYLPNVDGEYYKKNNFYHSSGDSSGTLNFQLIKKITQLTLASVAELSTTSSTTVQQNATHPTPFSLSQNYPNPFNPTTNISFRIQALGFTSLKIFDVLGRDIATLVNEKKNPGAYDVEWNASAFPSGVYFYRLRAGSFVETRTMILAK